MPYPLEYHSVVNRSMRRSIPASLPLCAVLLLPLFIASSFANQQRLHELQLRTFCQRRPTHRLHSSSHRPRSSSNHRVRP